MHKLDKDNYNDNWIGSLFKNPENVEVHYEVDASQAYEFDLWALVRYEGKWSLVGTHGCSCPSWEERAEIETGPYSRTRLIKEIKAGNYSSYTMPDNEEKALIKYLKEYDEDME